jgi:hypothetical protein
VAPAQAPAAPVIGQQVPGRTQPGPRTQPPTAKPTEVSGTGNGQGARVPNGAAGGDRPETGEDTADNVRIIPE